MEKQLVPNDVTLTSLRGLLREARKNSSPEEAVYVELKMWDYRGSNDIVETIGVYRSGTGEGTANFKNIEEARNSINGWKEEENADTPEPE